MKLFSEKNDSTSSLSSSVATTQSCNLPLETDRVSSASLLQIDTHINSTNEDDGEEEMHTSNIPATASIKSSKSSPTKKFGAVHKKQIITTNLPTAKKDKSTFFLSSSSGSPSSGEETPPLHEFTANKSSLANNSQSNKIVSTSVEGGATTPASVSVASTAIPTHSTPICVNTSSHHNHHNGHKNHNIHASNYLSCSVQNQNIRNDNYDDEEETASAVAARLSVSLKSSPNSYIESNTIEKRSLSDIFGRTFVYSGSFFKNTFICLHINKAG